jgi:hypothetical protein
MQGQVVENIFTAPTNERPRTRNGCIPSFPFYERFEVFMAARMMMIIGF